jgi:uncharacterized protein
MTAHGIRLDITEIRAFCEKWKIRELSVFGSILREDFRPDSDIDFLYSQEEGEWDLFDHFDMEEELAAILGRPVDLISRKAIEGSENRFYRREILSTARTIDAQR